MITINEEQLKLEIAHIFDSGANEMRVLEMVKNYIHTINQVDKNEFISDVTHRALLIKIEKLEADKKLLNFMVENGLGEDDMLNDITLPQEL